MQNHVYMEILSAQSLGNHEPCGRERNGKEIGPRFPFESRVASKPASCLLPESRIEHLGHLTVATLYQESEWKSLLLVLSLLLGLSPLWWTESHRIEWS